MEFFVMKEYFYFSAVNNFRLNVYVGFAQPFV